MIKYFITLLNLLLTLTLLSQDNALLWEINKKNHQKSYLFGTIHSQDSRVIEFAEQVLPFIRSQEAYAGEIILQPEDAFAILPFLFEKDSAKQCIHVFSAKEYQPLAQRFEEQLGKEMLIILPYMSPYLAGILLSTPSSESEELGFNFLDINLQNYADEHGLELISLESIASQMTYFQNMDVQKQRDFVIKLLNSEENTAEGLEKLIRIYLNQDIRRLLEEMEATRQDDPLFSEDFLIERNLLQLEGMVEAMKTKKMFTAVGAGHLPGKSGLIELLRHAGFELKPILLEK